MVRPKHTAFSSRFVTHTETHLPLDDRGHNLPNHSLNNL